MFNRQTFWTIYLSGIAVLFTLPTVTALIRRAKGLPLVIGLNVIGALIPVPCWIAAMGFAVCGASKRGPRRPVEPAEPARMILAPSPPRTPNDPSGDRPREKVPG
ncbi:MAG: hypothetical protein FWE35_04215 [Streptosporangiales bacterium]|nr:hypothetical protein [Streptosporangiales bacterium]